MKIALDMDGVMADFTPAFLRLCKSLGLVHPAYEWEGLWEYGFETKRAWGHIDQIPNWWMNLPPRFEGATLDRLNKMTRDHTVYVITNRKEAVGLPGYTTKEQVYHWFRSMGLVNISYNNISVGSKRGEKGKIAARLGVQVAVDDVIDNLIDYERAGIDAVCMDWVYNVDYEGRRVANLDEFMDYVDSISPANLHGRSRVSLTKAGEAWEDTGKLPV